MFVDNVLAVPICRLGSMEIGMKVIEQTTEFHIAEECAVAIGKFDGFHRGHQKLLDELHKKKQDGLATVVFTFFPSPAVFFGIELAGELTTIAEKRRIFEKAGVDYLIAYPFNQEIADMEPERYIKNVLINQLHAKCIVAGDDVSYGRHGSGDYRLLQKQSKVYGYQVIIIDKVLHNGREVSSSYVREEVKKGNMELVESLLGAPYYINGEIVHGKQFGRTIGMPTVNLIPPSEKLLPPKGVYYSYARFVNSADSQKVYPAITNIGTKPTVDNQSVMGVETFIYDFEQDVYGEELEVFLLQFKRPEMRFDNIEALKAQMAEDIAAGRHYHKARQCPAIEIGML